MFIKGNGQVIKNKMMPVSKSGGEEITIFTGPFLGFSALRCSSSVHCQIDHWSARNRIEPSSTINGEKTGVYVIRAFENKNLKFSSLLRRRKDIFFFFFTNIFFRELLLSATQSLSRFFLFQTR